MPAAVSTPLAPVLCIFHGAGPLPLLGDSDSAAHAKSMSTNVPTVLGLGTNDAPRAVVVVTAHWETAPEIRVSTGVKHELLFDYSGFPAAAYKICHDAPGHPEVAGWVVDALRGAGVEVVEDAERGWDHGVFVPMKLVDPCAKLPVVQVSVPTAHADQDPDSGLLLAMGRALAPLRERNVAILGSGAPSCHNLPAYFAGKWAKDPTYRARISAWRDRLDRTVAMDDVEKRIEALKDWPSWEGARDAHGRGQEEHFAPLLVCAAAAGDGVAEQWDDVVGGMEEASYYWK